LIDSCAVGLVDKACGLLTVPGIGPEKADCLIARLAARFAGARVVHRLDRDTSGVLVVARDAELVHRAVDLLLALPAEQAALLPAAAFDAFFDLFMRRLDTLQGARRRDTLLCAFAMVSRVRYPHFVNRYLKGRKSVPAVAIGLMIVATAVWWFHEALAIAMTAYALSGPATALVRRPAPAGAPSAGGTGPESMR
jgi:hypothetical protein